MGNKDYNFEMLLNPPVDKMFKDNLHVLFEIEIMQGERKIMADGQIRYRLNISEEKVSIIKQSIINMNMKQNYNPN